MLPKSPAQAGDAFQGKLQRGFFWRSVSGKARGFSPDSRIVAPYVANGVKVGEDALNFVCEGIIDALSCWQAFSLFAPAEWLKHCGLLATGSANFVGIFAKWAVMNYGSLKIKPRFCIVADNDEDGIKSAEILCSSLRKEGFSITVKLFSSPNKPKLDSNDVLEKFGEASLFSALADWKAQIGGR